jgi:hypothetical protein
LGSFWIFFSPPPTSSVNLTNLANFLEKFVKVLDVIKLKIKKCDWYGYQGCFFFFFFPIFLMLHVIG